MTDGGIRLGLLVESEDGTVMRSLTFASLDTSHSMEYSYYSVQASSYIINKEAAWDL